VHDASALELGDLGEGEAKLAIELLGVDAELFGQLTTNIDCRATPEFGTRGVPEDRALIVIAVRAERFTKYRLVTTVSLPTRERLTMHAALLGRARMTRRAVTRASPVDGTKARRGERREDHRVT